MSDTDGLPGSLAELLSQLDREGVTDYRRYSMVRRYMGFKAREKGVPISGSFELTPLCNLDCKMCYVHLNREQMHGAELLSVETWKDLMRQAVDAGMMYASLTGGECLTYPSFRELYLYLRSMGVETSILSNGLLMDDDMVEFLKENPPSSIQITVYGASEEGYERVTGHRSFAQVMENIQQIRRAELPLSVGITPNAYMQDGEEIVRMLHEMGLKFQINAGLMLPRDETGRTKHDADVNVYIRLMKLAHQLQDGVECVGCDENDLPDPGGGSTEAVKGVRCSAGRSTFCITWNGIMRPCNTFPKVSADVMRLGFAESWQRINAQVKEFPQPVECEGCAYSDRCKSCVSEHASGAPIGHANPARCRLTRRMEAERF